MTCRKWRCDPGLFKWVYAFTAQSGGWRATQNRLGHYLKKFGSAKEKYVPIEIKNMSKEIIKAFILSYTHGDGHIRTRSNGAVEHTLFTISKQMADDFQELAQKAGWNSSLRTVKPQKSIIIENGIERLIINSGGYCITFKKRATRAELLNRNFEKIFYNGLIYNLEIDRNHIIYVKRNGKPSWNGSYSPNRNCIETGRFDQVLSSSFIF